MHFEFLAKKMITSLKGKKILITAGPTWVKIDSVRVISNIATGQTGILLAQEAKRQGAQATLILGPVNTCCLDKSIKILPFTFFDELKSILIRELRSKKYDAVIHSAAVSDYRPQKIFRHKINSNLKKINLQLLPTPKLLDLIKKLNCSTLAVAFKFEPYTKANKLIRRAKTLFGSANMDLVVANSIIDGHYQAYILSKDKIVGPIPSKKKLSEELIKKIGEYFAGA